jgi:glutaredoxin 3
MTAPVLMYTTAVCPFCIRAKQLLAARGVTQIEEVRIDLDPDQRDQMMEKTNRRTVPQIYIGTTHVGGCDDLYALDAAGNSSRFSASKNSTSRIFLLKCRMRRKSILNAKHRRLKFNSIPLVVAWAKASLRLC